MLRIIPFIMHMNRRSFIRVVGGVGLSSVLAPRYAFGASVDAFDVSGVLAEASSFEVDGGWKLDTQHYQQMGGSYLLAHGPGQRSTGTMATQLERFSDRASGFIMGMRNHCSG